MKLNASTNLVAINDKFVLPHVVDFAVCCHMGNSSNSRFLVDTNKKIIAHHHDGLYFPAISVEIKQVGLLKILFYSYERLIKRVHIKIIVDDILV